MDVADCIAVSVFRYHRVRDRGVSREEWWHLTDPLQERPRRLLCPLGCPLFEFVPHATDTVARVADLLGVQHPRFDSDRMWLVHPASVAGRKTLTDLLGWPDHPDKDSYRPSVDCEHGRAFLVGDAVLRWLRSTTPREVVIGRPPHVADFEAT
jgi:hypothetical protein